MTNYEELQTALNQLEAISFRLTQLAQEIGCLVLQLDRLFVELSQTESNYRTQNATGANPNVGA